MMEKQIFKVGDRVYDATFGWGIVASVNKATLLPITVKFVRDKIFYTTDGKLYTTAIKPTLSFREYSLQGFSQKNPIDYKKYIGKWGKFWNDNLVNIFIDVLDNIYEEDDGSIKFISCEINSQYKNFEPLTEEQLKVLGLKNY